MKFPITLDIEKDTIWTSYKEQLTNVNDLESFKLFLEQWKEIYEFDVADIVASDNLLKKVKAEQVDNDLITLNIVLPQSIYKAMEIAKEYVVPLNTAFIQANGGLEKFQ